MLRKIGLKTHVPIVALILMLVGVTTWVLSPGKGRRLDSGAASQSARLQPTGYPQLVSIEPMQEADGEMCQLEPASASTTLVSELQTQIAEARSSAIDEANRPAIDADRKPVRTIHDSYSTYSAVGVDVNTNEVYLQDENLFGLMVFDRRTNTPPTAKFSEPKRRVRGSMTRLEFNCSLWIDPKSGDVYSVNNDMVDRMVVFPRGSEGNVAPMRELHTPHRTFGIAIDDEANELYMTVQHPPQVVVYRKQAAGEERPIRILAGEQTKMEDAHGIAIDTKNKVMFVANHGATAADKGSGGHFGPPSITVYPLKAEGNTPPLRVIEGPKTQFNWPALLYLDQERGELYVANDMANSILVFRASDSGDAAPIRVIQGAKTGLRNPTGVFLDAKNNELWVSNMGNHSATVFPRTADGDVAPLRTIRSAPLGKQAEMIGNPGAVGYDSKREEILVPN